MEEQIALYPVEPMPVPTQPAVEEPMQEEMLIGQISFDELVREIRT